MSLRNFMLPNIEITTSLWKKNLELRSSSSYYLSCWDLKPLMLSSIYAFVHSGIVENRIQGDGLLSQSAQIQTCLLCTPLWTMVKSFNFSIPPFYLSNGYNNTSFTEQLYWYRTHNIIWNIVSFQ